jgi:hypothetical protein
MAPTQTFERPLTLEGKNGRRVDLMHLSFGNTRATLRRGSRANASCSAAIA